jgi:hypothetical protein
MYTPESVTDPWAEGYPRSVEVICKQKVVITDKGRRWVPPADVPADATQEELLELCWSLKERARGVFLPERASGCYTLAMLCQRNYDPENLVRVFFQTTETPMQPHMPLQVLFPKDIFGYENPVDLDRPFRVQVGDGDVISSRGMEIEAAVRFFRTFMKLQVTDPPCYARDPIQGQKMWHRLWAEAHKAERDGALHEIMVWSLHDRGFSPTLAHTPAWFFTWISPRNFGSWVQLRWDGHYNCRLRWHTQEPNLLRRIDRALREGGSDA